MKLLVIGANGKAGSAIVNEAINAGLDVAVCTRTENKTKARHAILKDLFDLKFEDIKDFDVIIDAIGIWDNNKLYLHSKSLMYLCDLIANTDKRLFVVGGAGSLYVSADSKKQVYELPNFPDAFKALAKNMSDALDLLKKRDDVHWTYLSPACDFQVNGPKSGKYIIAGEVLTLNDKNESVISYLDYAKAMIDIVLKNDYDKKRISVLQK